MKWAGRVCEIDDGYGIGFGGKLNAVARSSRSVGVKNERAADMSTRTHKNVGQKHDLLADTDCAIRLLLGTFTR